MFAGGGFQGVGSFQAEGDSQTGYDVFIIAGQSNTYAGSADTGDSLPDVVLDADDEDIKQWGRYSPNVDTVITATEPMDSHDRQNAINNNWIGWAMTFAKIYKAKGYLLGNRQILLVHCGMGSSGFGNGDWNQGDTYYNDMIAKTNLALAEGSGVNELKGMLWHQGENDTLSSTRANNHNTALLNFIDDVRTDLSDSDMPIVVGNIVPAWATTTDRQTVETNHINVPSNRSYTGYADTENPTELTKSSISPHDNHFSAQSFRGASGRDLTDETTCGMAGRYWTGYLYALTNTP